MKAVLVQPQAVRIVAILTTLALVPLMLLPIAEPPPMLDLAWTDKLEHLLAYAVLCWLWFASGALVGLTTAAIWLYSVALECAQYWAPGRHCDLGDLMANTAGVLLAWSGWRWWRRPATA